VDDEDVEFSSPKPSCAFDIDSNHSNPPPSSNNSSTTFIDGSSVGAPGHDRRSSPPYSNVPTTHHHQQKPSGVVSFTQESETSSAGELGSNNSVMQIHGMQQAKAQSCSSNGSTSNNGSNSVLSGNVNYCGGNPPLPSSLPPTKQKLNNSNVNVINNANTTTVLISESYNNSSALTNINSSSSSNNNNNPGVPSANNNNLLIANNNNSHRGSSGQQQHHHQLHPNNIGQQGGGVTTNNSHNSSSTGTSSANSNGSGGASSGGISLGLSVNNHSSPVIGVVASIPNSQLSISNANVSVPGGPTGNAQAGTMILQQHQQPPMNLSFPRIPPSPDSALGGWSTPSSNLSRHNSDASQRSFSSSSNNTTPPSPSNSPLLSHNRVVNKVEDFGE